MVKKIDKIDVSIIVPVYNVEKFIIRTLNSLVEQEFNGNFEIVVVDDGSTDGSTDIILRFKQKYRNLKYVRKINGGLSSARNCGLLNASGKYVMFVDGDDIVEKNFIQVLYDFAERNKLDIGLSSHVKYWNNNKYQFKNRYKYDDSVVTGIEMLNIQLNNKDFQAEVWDDIYNRDFLNKNNLLFKDGIYHEDEEFTFKTLLKAKRVAYKESYKYIYLQRDNSIMSSGKVNKRVEDMCIIINETKKIFSLSSNYEKRLIYKRMLNLLNLTLDIIFNEKNNIDKLIYIILREVDLEFWNKNIIHAKTLQEKLIVKILKCNPKIYFKIFKLKKRL